MNRLAAFVLLATLQASGFIEDDSPFAEGGQNGTYYFEFSRPLRTMDRFQQAS